VVKDGEEKMKVILQLDDEEMKIGLAGMHSRYVYLELTQWRLDIVAAGGWSKEFGLRGVVVGEIKTATEQCGVNLWEEK
jgi:hypothetical protein